MPARYYLSPVVLLYKDPVTSAWTPALIPDTRQAFGSRVLIYARLHNSAALPDTRVKSWCLTWVDTDDATHALIAADPAILAVPLDPARLDQTFVQASAQEQQAISAGLEVRRLDSTWVTSSTTLRKIIGYVLRVLRVCDELGLNYPESDLGARFDALPAAQRNIILTYLQSKGAATGDIRASTPIRTVVQRFDAVDFGVIMFGNESF
jgi:hypothetical protein